MEAGIPVWGRVWAGSASLAGGAGRDVDPQRCAGDDPVGSSGGGFSGVFRFGFYGGAGLFGARNGLADPGRVGGDGGFPVVPAGRGFPMGFVGDAALEVPGVGSGSEVGDDLPLRGLDSGSEPGCVLIGAQAAWRLGVWWRGCWAAGGFVDPLSGWACCWKRQGIGRADGRRSGV